MLPIDLPHSAGIYKLFFSDSPEYCYIGSAINLRKRFQYHYQDLRKRKHANRHLQFAFNKYGEDALCHEIIEHVECKEDLIVREQYYIDLLKPHYNILNTARNSLGSVRTPEHRAKLSASHMGQTSWNKGKSPSPETLVRMSTSRKGLSSPLKGIPIPPDVCEQRIAKWRATMAARGGYASPPNKGQSIPPEMRKRISTTLLNKSPEEKAQMREKQQESVAKQAPEQKAQRHEKRKATIAVRYTDEEMSEILHAAQVNRPPEAKAKSLEKFSATLAMRTPERWAEITEKRLASIAANKARKLKEGQLSLWDDNTLPA